MLGEAVVYIIAVTSPPQCVSLKIIPENQMLTTDYKNKYNTF